MNCCNHLHLNDAGGSGGFHHGRRRFIKLAMLGAGASMFFGASPVRANGAAEALLLSCMDYRLMDDIAAHMGRKGLTGRYDHIVLAGASAGAVLDKFNTWHETFWSELKLAIDLHHVKKLVVMDHRDCGAYKVAFGAEHALDSDVELGVHSAVLNRLAASVRTKYPNLAVETYLMALDGSVTEVRQAQNCAPAAAASEATPAPESHG